MAIEWLTIEVPEGNRDRFIALDREIWTKFLSSCPGFIRKQVWVNPEKPEQVCLVVEWESREEWKAIDPEALAEVDRSFVAAMGQSYAIVYAGEYMPVG
ncbi:MAG: TIGR03792 family protein [Alkalinema sp. RU_4_3]|nr:TIGR03792 family protein [Alkalinema sp. RU_4_3]